jgi:type IV pilus assembly protein PilE
MKIKMKGFTLIEVMIVVAVLAILATIAVPSYQGTIRKTKRAEAKGALLENVLRLERCYTVSSTYIDCAGVNLGNTEKGYYTIAFDATPTQTTYILSATAVGGQANDTDCAEFNINEKGVKTATSANCW